MGSDILDIGKIRTPGETIKQNQLAYKSSYNFIGDSSKGCDPVISGVKISI